MLLNMSPSLITMNKSIDQSTTAKSFSVDALTLKDTKTIACLVSPSHSKNILANLLSSQSHQLSAQESHHTLVHIQNNGHIFLSTSIIKYKPLIASNGVQRFCIASNSAFLCYSSEWNAYSPTFKPICQIPYSSMNKVEK